jgi:hypothetical protein
MTAIVFSKDRALQLDAFLRSFRKHVLGVKLIVIVAVSDVRHRLAYRLVFDRHPWATAVWEAERLKETLLSVIPPSGSVVFFVDDQIFIRSWNGVGCAGVSLRLAPHLTYCYTMNRPQTLPFFEATPGLLRWRWTDGHLDWAYPLSLDGHVFDAAEMATLIGICSFRSPNTLETALQEHCDAYLRGYPYGFCYRESRVINVPWNTVQTDYDNRNEGDSIEAFLEHWEAGKQIALGVIYGVVNQSVHQALPLVLEAR